MNANEEMPRLGRRANGPQDNPRRVNILESTSRVNEKSRGSVEEVFAPAVVAAAEHAHDLAAGVEREGARLAQQDHVVDFAEQAIAFSAVALVAAGDEIFPCGVAAARTRNHVIERELAGRVGFAAVLAGVAVTEQDVFAREGAGLVRNAAVFKKTDDGGHGDDGALRMKRKAVDRKSVV